MEYNIDKLNIMLVYANIRLEVTMKVGENRKYSDLQLKYKNTNFDAETVLKIVIFFPTFTDVNSTLN